MPKSKFSVIFVSSVANRNPGERYNRANHKFPRGKIIKGEKIELA